MKFWPNLKHSPKNRLVAMMLLSLLMLVGLSSQSAHAKFISADPVTALQHLQNGNVQGFTPYVYANNNPYKFTDPDGQMPLLVPAVLFLGKEAAGEAFEQATGLPAPTVKGAAKQVLKSTRKLRGGNFNKAKSERIQESGGTCEYCQSNPATQGDHAKTLNSFKSDVNNGKMTISEAKETANSKSNIVASCKQCNQVDKHTKDLGTGPGQYNPPNPNDRIKDIISNK